MHLAKCVGEGPRPEGTRGAGAETTPRPPSKKSAGEARKQRTGGGERKRLPIKSNTLPPVSSPTLGGHKAEAEEGGKETRDSPFGRRYLVTDNTHAIKDSFTNNSKDKQPGTARGSDTTWLPAQGNLKRRQPCWATQPAFTPTNSIRGQLKQGDATQCTATTTSQRGEPRGPRRARHRRNHQGSKGSSNDAQQGLDPEPNQRSGSSRGQEEQDNDRPSNATKDDDEPPSASKKQQRNTSRGAKKGDKRDASEHPEAGVPGPSKRAKANNGEQISMIVQECLKSMVPLLFANPGGARKPKGSSGADSNGDTASSDTRGKGSRVNRAEAPCTRCPSPERGDEAAASTSVTASPKQVWGTDVDKNARR
ncbi:hypothetical protein NDU88_003969 [Pleurodeles waltl]|uniref:Uncharacterized protein n=1 Tax=Pleurodeles waltl TaxID=8319 RepID=A0AAV7T7Z1_PLEWA|nr:hypothetical protein NDU88_003969 [Pleurodeles waltl]